MVGAVHEITLEAADQTSSLLAMHEGWCTSIGPYTIEQMRMTENITSRGFKALEVKHV